MLTRQQTICVFGGLKPCTFIAMNIDTELGMVNK